MTDLKLELPNDDILVDTYLRDPHTGMFPPGKIVDHLCLRAVARVTQAFDRKQIADALRSMLSGGRRFFREETQSMWMPESDVNKFANALDPPSPAEKKLDEDTLAVVCDWMRRTMGEDHAYRFRARFGATGESPTNDVIEGVGRHAPRAVAPPPAKPRMVSVDAVRKQILEERGDVVKWT